jgi:flagellar basal-body rod modification protein FlgD
MTSPVSSTATTASGAAGATPSATVKGNDLDRDAFLKLLVAQMRYQDPNKPVDSSQFMAQTAQFTMVDKLSALETSQQQLLLAQVVLGATTLVGRNVSYVDDAGATVTGVASSATLTGSSPTLRVGNTDVPLSSVTEVRTTAG